jgi:GH24 family phage-related lysozyme (muramidase)
MADTFTDAIDARSEGRPMFSQEGLDILRTFEGFRPNAYYDLDNKKKKGKLTVVMGSRTTTFQTCVQAIRLTRGEQNKCCPTLSIGSTGRAFSIR